MNSKTKYQGPTLNNETNCLKSTDTTNYETNFEEPMDTMNFEVNYQEPADKMDCEINCQEPTDIMDYEINCKESSDTKDYKINCKEPTYIMSYKINYQEPTDTMNYEINCQMLTDKIHLETNCEEADETMNYETNFEQPAGTITCEITRKTIHKEKYKASSSCTNSVSEFRTFKEHNQGITVDRHNIIEPEKQAEFSSDCYKHEHLLGTNKLKRCYHCKRFFRTETQFTDHVCFFCEFCNKNFTSARLFSQHKCDVSDNVKLKTIKRRHLDGISEIVLHVILSFLMMLFVLL